jgi:hypothetical protein
MSKLLWKALLAAPAAVGAAFAVSSAAVAATAAPELEVSAVDSLEQVSFDQEPIQLAQITSVSELTDVLPSDWAFQALQSLVENYGCIQGYPDRTFRGQRSLTRFEFAAGLNACLDVMAVLISQSGINPDDLAAINRLQQEFQAELATLRGRVDALEAETATLRAQQFSTTTKLRGQADMAVVVPFDTINTANLQTGDDFLETSATVEARARLNFDSSFTGNDRLRIRLQGSSGNNALAPFGGLANSSGTTNTTFDLVVDDFYYSFPLGNRIDLTLSARGLQGDDWVTSTIVPFDGPAVADASKPQFYNSGGSSSGGPGLGINFALTDSIVLDLGYSASAQAFDPAVGIFSANTQSYIAQLNFVPEGAFSAAFAYMHNDDSAGFAQKGVFGAPAAPAGAVNTYAGLASLDFGSFFVAGHFAYQDYQGGDDISWSAGAGFNDFGLEGSQLGVYGAQLPQLAGYANSPFLVEGYYQIPFNQFLTVTPAVIYGDANLAGGADNIGWWGVVRATFRF